MVLGACLQGWNPRTNLSFVNYFFPSLVELLAPGPGVKRSETCQLPKGPRTQIVGFQGPYIII